MYYMLFLNNKAYGSRHGGFCGYLISFYHVSQGFSANGVTMLLTIKVVVKQ